MKNKSFTIVAATLDGGEQVVDMKMSITVTSPLGNQETKLWLPMEFEITNTTSAILEYNFFTDDEYTEYQASPTNYDFIPLGTNITIADEAGKFPQATKFVVRKKAGETVLFDLTGVFINYRIR